MAQRIISLLLIFVLIGFADPISASRYDDLKEKVSNQNSSIEQIEKEIARYRLELSKTKETAGSLKNAIEAINLNRRKLGADINLTESRVQNAKANIERLDLDIMSSGQKIESERDQIGNILRNMEDTGNRSFIEIIFSGEYISISDVLGEIGDFQNINTQIQSQIEKLRTAKEHMLEQKGELEEERKNLLELHSDLADQKFILDEERKSQDALLAETKNKESNYKKILADAEARKKQFEKELEDFAAQIKQEINPGSYPPLGSHVLSLPLDDAKITQHFGKTKDAARLYISGTHNGIDFGASRGTKIYSAAEGVVMATGNTDESRGCSSYGKWVLIKHTNGLATLYAHLDVIKVSQGQPISRHDLIGYSGKTGYATGPHLHFGVYVASAVQIMKYEKSRFCKEAIIPIAPASAYLDPEAYL